MPGDREWVPRELPEGSLTEQGTTGMRSERTVHVQSLVIKAGKETEHSWYQQDT